MPPTILDKLNEDELFNIFDLLNQQDLYAFVQVSKYAHKLALNHLYKHVQWTWNPEQGEKMLGMVRLVRTLVVHEQQGSHIRSVCFEMKEPNNAYKESPWHQYDPARCDPSEFVEYRPVVLHFPRLTGPACFASRWARALQHGKPDAYLALLLSLAPRLRVLKVVDSRARLGSMLFSIADSLTCHNLEEVEYRSTFLSEHLSARQTWEPLVFFFLPNIKRLTVGLQNPSSLFWPHSDIPVPSQQLEYLSLSQVREFFLEEILSRTPNLKILEWELSFTVHDYHSHATNVVNLDQLATSIATMASALTSLTLSCRWIHEQDPSDDLTDVPSLAMSGSLRQLSRLNHLHTLTLSVLLVIESGITLEELVNTSLRHLVLVQEDKYYEYLPFDVIEDHEESDHLAMYLEGWLEYWQTENPTLHKITLRSNRDFPGWQYLWEARKELGVVVQDGDDVVWDPALVHDILEAE